MTHAPIPDNDAQRVAALRELLILDSPPEERFDRVVRFLAEEFDAPIALVSLIDQNRQWFKSAVGLDVCETTRDISFCGHAIVRPDIFVIEDALRDPRFADNPLVTGAPHIRFYAGAPLVTPAGVALGTLCLIDTVPRPFTVTDRAVLGSLRQVVVEEILRSAPGAA